MCTLPQRRTGVQLLMGVCTARLCLCLLIAVVFAHAQEATTAAPGKAARQKIVRERILDHFCIGIEAPIEWMNETRDKSGAKLGKEVKAAFTTK